MTVLPSAREFVPMLSLVRHSAGCLVLVCSLTAAAGAELRIDPSQGPQHGAVFEGKIEVGDYERFRNFILGSGQVTEIYLGSTGGNVAEAMKIGVLTRLLKLSTVVPSKQLTHEGRSLALARHGLRDSGDYACASACFFIFVAGIHRGADAHGPPILGVHAPFLRPNDLKRLGPDQATAASDREHKIVESYLTIMDVPARYAEVMYSTPKNAVRWIRNDDFEADFAGFIPELRDSVKQQCATERDLTQGNARSKDLIEARENCEIDVQNALASRAVAKARKEPTNESSQSILNRVPPASLH